VWNSPPAEPSYNGKSVFFSFRIRMFPMNKGFPLASFALALVGLQHAQAADVTFAVGQSSESEMVYRLGLQWDFQRSWWETSTGRLTGYWDTAYSYWQGDQTSSNHSLSLSPVFVYEF